MNLLTGECEEILQEQALKQEDERPKLPPLGTPIAHWSAQDIWNLIRSGPGELAILMGREPPANVDDVTEEDFRVILQGKVEVLRDLL